MAIQCSLSCAKIAYNSRIFSHSVGPQPRYNGTAADCFIQKRGKAEKFREKGKGVQGLAIHNRKVKEDVRVNCVGEFIAEEQTIRQQGGSLSCSEGSILKRIFKCQSNILNNTNQAVKQHIFPAQFRIKQTYLKLSSIVIIRILSSRQCLVKT